MTSTMLVGAALMLQGFGPPPPHGVELASWNGLTAYHQDPAKTSLRGEYGLNWQCVELVNRYLVSLGHRNLSRTGHGVSYYEQAEEKGLVRFPNGGTEAPLPGDLIVFKNPSFRFGYGHVAVITEVHDDHIVILQQNGGIDLAGVLMRPDPVRKLRLRRESFGYRVSPYHPNNVTLGWVRMPPAQPDAPGQFANAE